MQITSELRTKNLWVVQQVSPDQLHLRDSSNILQQTNQISADYQALHELQRRRDGVVSVTRRQIQPTYLFFPFYYLLPQHADAEVDLFLAKSQQVWGSMVDDQAKVGVD